MHGRTRALSAFAAAAYLLAAAAAAAVGFRFWVPWAVVQLLDRVDLERTPASALLALHSQPPALNAILAAAVGLGGLLDGGPEPVLSVVFFVAACALVVVLAQLVRVITDSWWLAIAAVLVTVADPALHFYRTVAFYELPLAVLLLAALWAAWRFLATGRERQLLAFVAAIGGMALLRSLYHPLWAAGMFALLVAGRARLAGPVLSSRARGRAGWLRAAALLVGMLAAWPLKNALLFGAPVNSSWVGYNLSRGTPVRHPALWSYVETGEVAEELRQNWRRRAPAFLRDHPALTAAEKSTGNRNWNHYAFLLTYRELAREAWRWRRQHPGEWLRRSAANYLLWGRPTYLDSYWGTARGPEDAWYRRYAAWHQRLLFPDLRRPVVALTPTAAVHAQTVVSGGPAPYTLFAVAGLPVLLIALAWLLPRRLASDPGAWVVLLAAVALLWVLLVPCLSDGTEGNRMRYPVSPCLLLLAAWVVSAGRGHRAGGKRHRFAEANPDER